MFVEGGLHPKQIKALREMSLQRMLDLSLAGIERAGDLRKAMIHVAIDSLRSWASFY